MPRPSLFAAVVFFALSLACADGPPAEAQGSNSFNLRVYDVRDILHRRKDFPAPKLGLSGIEEAEDPFGAEEEDDEPWLTGETLVELVQQVVAPGTWGPGGNTITYHRGRLFIEARDEHVLDLTRRLSEWRNEPKAVPRPQLAVHAQEVKLADTALRELKRRARGKSAADAFRVRRTDLDRALATLPASESTTPTRKLKLVGKVGLQLAVVAPAKPATTPAPRAGKRAQTGSSPALRAWPLRDGGLQVEWRSGSSKQPTGRAAINGKQALLIRGESGTWWIVTR